MKEVVIQLARIEEVNKNVIRRLEDIKNDFKRHCDSDESRLREQKMDHKEFVTWIKRSFANKVTEKIVVAMVAMVLSAFMVGVIALIFAPRAFADIVVSLFF